MKSSYGRALISVREDEIALRGHGGQCDEHENVGLYYGYACRSCRRDVCGLCGLYSTERLRFYEVHRKY